MKKIYATILFVFAFISFSNAQITFNFTNSAEGFTPTGTLPTASGPGVVLNPTTTTYFFSTGRTNAYLDQTAGVSPVNSANYNTITLVIKNNSKFTAFSLRSGATVITSPAITITTGDTGFQTYKIPLTGFANWTGIIDPIRIFFGAGTTLAGDSIEIDSISFTNEALGTNDFTKVENSIQLAPNPVTDILNINTEDTIQKISVTDLLGRTVLTPSASKEINVSELKKGVYIISVATDKGVTNKKIIKN